MARALVKINKKPTYTRYTSGSGTYIPPANVKMLKITMVGGGGGGGGSGSGVTSLTGTNGGNTTFGTSLLTATGGAGSTSYIIGGPSGGGTATINSPAVRVVTADGNMGTCGMLGGASYYGVGGHGGSTALAGARAGGTSGAGLNSITNSGSGGGGGGAFTNSVHTGNGGSGGGYLEAVIYEADIQPSYAYSVGTGGPGGPAGTSGFVGGNGASGIIIIEEHY